MRVSVCRLVLAAVMPVAVASLVVVPSSVTFAAPAGSSVFPNAGFSEGGTEIVVPVPSSGLTFTDVSAGNSFSLAVGSNGNTYAWGAGNAGQLGNGANDNKNAPVRVRMPEGVSFTQVSAGSTDHSLAVGSDGTTYAWGSGYYGQLGVNSSGIQRNVPVAVSAPAEAPGVRFTQVSAGGIFSLARGDDSNTYAWGWGGMGQLGNGANQPAYVPVPVSVPEGRMFTQVSAGADHSVAVALDADTYAWGAGADGQLGNGAKGSRVN